ncbi:MAG: energy transducer TonB [Acidobacteria bacterium]|nr:energy transducer TonB [Acidobacteriota bacterium]
MSGVTELHAPEVKNQGKTDSVPSPIPALQPTFFRDILLEVDGKEKRRRGLATFSSVVLQCLLLGIMLIIPLMFTEALPKQQLLTFLVAPPPPPPPPPPAAAAAVQVVRRIESDFSNGQLRTPSRIPEKVQMIKEEEAPPQGLSTGGVIGGVPGGIPGGQLGGVIGGIISSTNNTAMVPKLAASVPKRIRVSQGVTKGLLVRKVEPIYPKIAAAARIQGIVVLSAVISKTGEIQNLEAVSGHPMLVPAAIAAVKQWQYRPFLLNGEPLEVETTVTVTFQLSN